jgi:hypothetical protein
MKMTLNKANNILQKFKTDPSIRSAIPIIQNSPFIMNDFNLAMNPKEIVSSLEESKKEFLSNFSKSIVLISDLYYLKTLIFDWNSKLELNKVLNDIEKTKTILRWQERMLSSLPARIYTEKISEEEVQKLQEIAKTKEGPNSVTLSLRCIPIEELQKNISELKKHLNLLEDQKTKINATEIDVILSKEAMEILGL